MATFLAEAYPAFTAFHYIAIHLYLPGLRRGRYQGASVCVPVRPAVLERRVSSPEAVD